MPPARQFVDPAAASYSYRCGGYPFHFEARFAARKSAARHTTTPRVGPEPYGLPPVGVRPAVRLSEHGALIPVAHRVTPPTAPRCMRVAATSRRNCFSTSRDARDRLAVCRASSLAQPNLFGTRYGPTPCTTPRFSRSAGNMPRDRKARPPRRRMRPTDSSHSRLTSSSIAPRWRPEQRSGRCCE